MTGPVWAYHDATSYDRRDLGGRALDWGIQPEVFKTYPGLEAVKLPEPTELPPEALSQLVTDPCPRDLGAEITLQRLARILSLAHSLTARTRYGGAYFYFRSVASAGALYPFETYIGVMSAAGLRSGLYHHNVRDQGLTLLRAGSIFYDLRQAVPLEEGDAPPIVFFLSSIFFRSSWKYRDRAYRYHLLDTGHLLENLILALRSEGLTCTVHYDFDDSRVNGLLCVDPVLEACLAVVTVRGKVSEGRELTELPGPDERLIGASRVSPQEVDYPAIRKIHEATSLPTLIPSSPPDMGKSLGIDSETTTPVPRPGTWPDAISYAEAVHRRRSMRNFVKQDLSADCLAALLTLVCAEPDSAKCAEPVAESALSLGFLAGQVEGLAPGFYLLNRQAGLFGVAAGGYRIDRMTSSCLDQGWLANCALHFLFMCNLEVMEQTWGARAYRHVMLGAGRIGQRIYLAATSMRLGCCGIGAYYDGEAAQVLGLNDRSRLLYLVATGPVKKYVGL
jgi:SagB-type dehydrogenase family enzyme